MMKWLALFLAVALIGVSLQLVNPAAFIDWRGAFYPAALGWKPYNVYGFYSPVWTSWILKPLTFSMLWGGGILFAANVFSYAYALRRFKVGLWASAVIAIPAIWDVLHGNIGGITLLGVFMPAPIGVLFLTMKPQIGAIPALYLMYKDWKENKTLRSPIVLFTMLAANMLLYPHWLPNMFSATNLSWNASLFPYSIPFGLFALGLLVKRQDVRYAFMASPLMTPYMTWTAWLFFLIGVFGK